MAGDPLADYDVPSQADYDELADLAGRCHPAHRDAALDAAEWATEDMRAATGDLVDEEVAYRRAEDRFIKRRAEAWELGEAEAVLRLVQYRYDAALAHFRSTHRLLQDLWLNRHNAARRHGEHRADLGCCTSTPRPVTPGCGTALDDADRRRLNRSAVRQRRSPADVEYRRRRGLPEA